MMKSGVAVAGGWAMQCTVQHWIPNIIPMALVSMHAIVIPLWCVPDDAIDQRYCQYPGWPKRYSCNEKERRTEQKKYKQIQKRRSKVKKNKSERKKIIENTPKLTQNEMDIGNTYRAPM